MAQLYGKPEGGELLIGDRAAIRIRAPIQLAQHPQAGGRPGGADQGVPLRCVRKANGGGPSARNYGAQAGVGELLLFLDQDLRIPPRFVCAHVDAQRTLGSAAVCARYENRLLEAEGPFSRWYASMSKQWEDGGRGSLSDVAPSIVEIPPVLLTSTNLSIPRALFLSTGGLPVYRQTGVEDQAFGLLLGRRGVRVFRLNDVCAQHVETRARIDGFRRRQRIGMAATAQLICEFPEVFGPVDATVQHRINGPIHLGVDPPLLVLRKALKSGLTSREVEASVRVLIRCFETVAPRCCLLGAIYRAVIGADIQRGWREGLAEVAALAPGR